MPHIDDLAKSLSNNDVSVNQARGMVGAGAASDSQPVSPVDEAISELASLLDGNTCAINELESRLGRALSDSLPDEKSAYNLPESCKLHSNLNELIRHARGNNSMLDQLIERLCL